MVDPPSNEHRSVRRRKPRDVRFYPLHDRLIKAEAQVQVRNEILDISEAIKSFFLSPSRSEMFDRTKRPTSRPDSNRSSHPASAQGAHYGR